jgi:hypothetical protein
VIRARLALGGLLLAVPAAAQDTPVWVGVWQGRVGPAPVRLCADVWGDGNLRGSYYYLSRLEPIALSDSDSEGGWTEQAPGSDATAQWAFAEQSGTRLRGTWRQGRRSLPFELEPVAWREGEWGGACSSDAFLAPRVGGGAIVTDSGSLSGWPYTTRTYRPAAHFADDVAIESFGFAAEKPGDAAINAALEAHLPREAVGDAFLQCLAGAIASLGHDGGFEEMLRPVVVTPAFLVALESSSTYCGGAHPNHFYRYLTFDRQSGVEVDLSGWLGTAAVEHHPAGHGSEAYFTVRPALRELILSRNPTDDFSISIGVAEQAYPEDCRELVLGEEFWTLGLSRSGMLFVPVVPHVAGPCAETFTVPWDALAPFLDADGRAGLARLHAD